MEIRHDASKDAGALPNQATRRGIGPASQLSCCLEHGRAALLADPIRVPHDQRDKRLGHSGPLGNINDGGLLHTDLPGSGNHRRRLGTFHSVLNRLSLATDREVTGAMDRGIAASSRPPATVRWGVLVHQSSRRIIHIAAADQYGLQP